MNPLLNNILAGLVILVVGGVGATSFNSYTNVSLGVQHRIEVRDLHNNISRELKEIRKDIARTRESLARIEGKLE